MTVTQAVQLDESFGITLRARRNSSARPIVSFSPSTVSLPVLGQSTPTTVPGTRSPSPDYMAVQTLASISPLSSVHMSSYDTTVNLARHYGLNMPRASDDFSPSPSSTPTAVNSRAASPTKEFDDIDNSTSPENLRWRLASGFFACFACGWGDGVTGTVLPFLTAEFHMSSTTSSLLFAGTTSGFFIGTFLVETILKYFGRYQLEDSTKSFLPRSFLRFTATKRNVGHSASQGRHRILILASIIHALYFILMGSRAGFPVMFVAYALAAFSRAILTAPLNAYFASGPKQSLGYAYGLNSFGSVVSPLVCQTLIASGVPWFQFYYGSLVLSAINITFLSLAFKPTHQERLLERRGVITMRNSEAKKSRSGRSSPVLDAETSHLSFEHPLPARNTLRIALLLPYQWAFSFFALLYCGSETVTQGFMVTYLLERRHANPKTIGYVTSGFWGGISLGRFLWGYSTQFLTFTQRKYTVHLCIGIAISMHLLIWFINSSVENAVSGSIIGVLYGPILPACLSMANDILPAHVHMVAMALISSFASLGGAIFPLIAGAVIDTKTIKSLPYVSVPLAATMFCLWALFPTRKPARTTVD